ncbi:MAG TPA: phage holin family protein [Syntrophales bacterium]|nr:phage holin family protein [Syntrophales bacterium]HPC33186.1 phage holin family protein [Syntrophales bacterium]HQI36045.1 phage holin family protein [Syntrophales bacterium]HRU89158.1 phage holin family protein [Syntrophales bacterium]
MTGLIVRWLIMTIAILAAAYFIEGIYVRGFGSAFLAAAFLGLLNTLFRPLLIILTLPINILTLGIFTFVINALLLKMTAAVIPGFAIQGFWPAIFGALVISVVNWLLHLLIADSGK